MCVWADGGGPWPPLARVPQGDLTQQGMRRSAADLNVHNPPRGNRFRRGEVHHPIVRTASALLAPAATALTLDQHGHPTPHAAPVCGQRQLSLHGLQLLQPLLRLVRADRFEAYAERCFAAPHIVGYHWFQYTDEPAEGRFDREDNNWGLVTVADEPYTVLVERMAEVNRRPESSCFPDAC